MDKKTTRRMTLDDEDDSYNPKDEPKRNYKPLNEDKKQAIYKAFQIGLLNGIVSKKLNVGESNVKAYRAKHKKIQKKDLKTNQSTPVKLKKERQTRQFEYSSSTQRNEAQSTKTIGSFSIIGTGWYFGMLVYEINPQSKLAQNLMTQVENCQWCKHGSAKLCPHHSMI